jgi:hypothetical protein
MGPPARGSDTLAPGLQHEKSKPGHAPAERLRKWAVDAKCKISAHFPRSVSRRIDDTDHAGSKHPYLSRPQKVGCEAVR